MPSNILGQARAGKAGDLSIGTVIPFSTTIPQVAGQQYAILVDYPEAPTFFNGIQNTASWNGSDGNPYPAGTMFSTFDNGVTWTSSQSHGLLGLMGLLRSSNEGADDGIAAAALHVALGCKRGAGLFAVAMPMSSVGG